MRIAILGTGGIALAYAAMLSKGGYEVVLFSLSGSGGASLKGKSVTSSGPVEHTFQPETTDSLPQALEGTEAVIIATAANHHNTLIDLLVPALQDGQRVLVSAELSLSGYVLANRLKKAGKEISVTSLSTTLLTARRAGISNVTVGLLRKICQAATDPACKQTTELTFWSEIFGPVITPAPARLWITFSNVNATVHVANALCNFTRIENGESWSNYAGITPSVANLIAALDQERLSIAKAYNLDVVSLKDQYHRSFGFPAQMSLSEITASIHQKRNGLPRGPIDIETRYITEDVPFGLVFMEHFAAIKQVPVPLHTAAIDILSSLYKRSFREENPFVGDTIGANETASAAP